MANKKVVSVLSTAAIGTLIATAVGSTVFAAVDGLVVKNVAGAYLNYDLDALKASVVNDALGQAGAELYKDFDASRTAGSIVSYHDNKVGFVDAASVQKAALDAALAGTNFALDTFTESSKETVLPATVYQATVTNGKVVAGAEVKPTSTPVAVALKVDSVTAISANRLKVTFTQAVDKTSAETIGNYLVNNAALAAPATAVLQADGKSVILTLTAALANNTTNVYQVNPIASSTSSLVVSPIFTTTEKITDTVAPTVTSVVAKTNTNIATSVTITYSEPVASGVIKIDGVNVAAAAGLTQTINGLNLDATKTHTLEYVNLTDLATVTANVTAYASTTFSVTKDVTAPTATVAPYGDKQILVTFSKAMNPATVIAGNFAIANEALTPYALSVAAKAGDTTNTQYVVTITTAPIYSTTVTSRAISIAMNGNIQDSLGNALAAVTKSVTLTKDTTAPTVTDVVAEKNLLGQTTAIIVKYSEPLAAVPAGVLSNTLTVVNAANGVLITAPGLAANSDAIALGDTQVRFAFAAPAVQNVKWTVTVPTSLVTDASEGANVSTGLSKLVDMSQAASATTFVLTGTPAAIAGNVITVTYPTAVKGGAVAGSATDPNNYSVNGSVLPAGTSITLNAAMTTATITLPAGSIATSDAAAIFRIANVQNSLGTTVTPFLQTLAVTDNTKPVLNSAVLNTDDTITLGFSETVAGLLASDLVVKVNGVALSVPGVLSTGTGLNAGKYVLDLSTFVKYTVGTGTFVDLNNDGLYTAGEPVVAATDVTASAMSAIPGITSVTIGMKATGIAGADAATNTITPNTTITVK